MMHVLDSSLPADGMLFLPFFMPRQHGMNSQMKVIASVSTASLLGCDAVDICLSESHFPRWWGG